MKVMFVFAILSACAPAHAEDAPTPVAAEVAAPHARIVANSASGFEGSLDEKHLMAIFRAVVRETPNHHRIMVYVPPTGTASLATVLNDALKLKEASFERQRSMVDSAVGRPYFTVKKTDTAVLEAVASDPGGVGVVSGDALLPETVRVLWTSTGGTP